MTDPQWTGPGWGNEQPTVIGAVEPDWAAMAERQQQEDRLRKQIRMTAIAAVATVAVGGIVVTSILLSGAIKPKHTTASSVSSSNGITGGSLVPGTVGSGAAGSGGTASGGPSAAPATTGAAGGANPAGTQSAAPAGSAAAQPGGQPGTGSTQAPPPPVQNPGANPGPNPGPGPTRNPSTPPPPANNPYTQGQACGSGYSVIDSHALGGATIYLLYNNGNADNCVVTMVDHPNGATAMNATLAVQGGGSAANPGNFTYYAGPAVEHAPHACVEWGGSWGGNSWTSSWSHCG